MLEYPDFISFFPNFATNDANGQAQISALLQSAQSEIDAVEWGKLYKSGIMNLVACRLTQIKTAEAQLRLIESTSSSDTTTTITPSSLFIKRYTVDDEYSVEYDMSQAQSITKSVQSSLSSGSGKNYYCEEYKRLQDIVGIGIIYSGEYGSFYY